MSWTIAAGTLGAMVTCRLFGQPAGVLKFEVASIKPSAPGGTGLMIAPSPLSSGELRVSNITLKSLVMAAYDVRDFQVSGGPGWVNSERYDVVARPERFASAGSPPAAARKITDDQRKSLLEQRRLRTQALLADRFHLVVHRESKEQQVYALLGGKNGSKLEETKEGAVNGGQMAMGIGRLEGRGVSPAELAGVLAVQLGRPVTDQTGLHGRYDIKLEWAPDPSLGGPLDRLPPGVEAPPRSNAEGPTLLTAIQEQLGLQLKSQRAPVEIIVIDSVERPSEN